MTHKARKSFLFVVSCLGLSGLLSAQEAQPPAGASRPRIGLVLSGGGARGAAHIGVLKVLEENRVPVDVIAGTSMGAVVGGLYASGLSAADIERVMTSVDWQDAFRDRPARADLNFRRKLEDQTYLVKFPLGLKGGQFRVPRGLVQGQKLTQILRGLTLPVAQIQDFDDLAIPFRAVATDIVTGDRVILERGDLTTAMRASLTAPGVFSPVEADDGRLLVDGGLSSNLPIDVAREMGVDILIVVDCGFPLLERGKLVSVATVSNQMLAILIRHNTAVQRKTLKDSDVLIDPALGDFSSLDFSQHAKAMRIGEEAARGQTERLAALSVAPEEFERIVTARAATRSGLPRVEFLRVEPGSERYAGAIESLFSDQIGKPVNVASLERRVGELYGQGNLEILDYRLVRRPAPENGEEPEPGYGLAVNSRRNSWGPNYLRFGLQLQNDFDGNSSFNAAARSTMAEITEYGGEWVVDLQVGETPRVATELYLPVGYRSRWFVMPHVELQIRTLPLANDEEQILAEYRVKTADFGVDLGRELGHYGEIRVGAGRTSGSTRVRVGDPLLPPTEFTTTDFFGEFRYDTVDNMNFPRHGANFQIGWKGERASGGDSQDTDLLVFDQLYAHSWGRNTAILWTTAGTQLDDDVDVVRSYFTLGGFLNLSAVTPETLVGPHFAIARGIYYRQVGRGGQGFLNVPVFIGTSLELGNVWSSRSDISASTAKTNGSVFLGLDTLLGPVYFATGFDDQGESNIYLFLGRTF